MPTHLRSQFTEYETEYGKIKRGRKLAWMDQLGTIELDVHLEDRTISIETSPIQAAVLYAFQERDRMTITEVVGVLESGLASARRAVMFWVLHGVLKEIAPDTFYVLEQAETSPPNQSRLPSNTMAKGVRYHSVAIAASTIKRPICRGTTRI